SVRARGLGAVSSGWCQRRWDGGSQFGVRHEGGGVVSGTGQGMVRGLGADVRRAVVSGIRGCGAGVRHRAESGREG
ncbi:MAG: hypothetical protein LBL06_01015, partial [Treponema sp.]|nr:hypothetical protein [Treponema sp.]